MTNDFYGNEDTTIPQASNYYRLEEGENIFRILGSFKDKTVIQGWEYWKTIDGKRKPIRLPKDQTVPVAELEVNQFGDVDTAQFFWAFPVWSYHTKQIQICEISKKTILREIKKYIENPKWGNPLDYDFIVTKGKPNEKPLYTVGVNPKEPLDAGILKLYHDMDINMDALFTGGDPFAGKPVDPDSIPDTL